MSMRKRRPVLAIWTIPCVVSYSVGGVVHQIGGTFRKRTREEIDSTYRSRNYQYAIPGDYVGLVRSNGGSIVDFHITAQHALLRDPFWLGKVIYIERVARVEL